MKRKFLSSLVASCLAIALLATGCGAKTGTSSTSGSSTAAKSTEAPAKLTPVKLQLKWLPQAQFMGFYVAAAKGYYKEQGIDIQILPGGPDIIPANQVAVGAADFAISNLYSLLPFLEQGYPLTEIAQVFQKNSFRLVSLKKNNINGVQDLKGKKVGAWLGTGDYLLYAMLDKYGLNKDKDLTVAKQDYTMDGLLKGTFDVASAQSYNEYLVLLESGIPASDINVIDVNKEGVAMLEDAILANTEWLAKNKDTAAKFLKASIKGWADAAKDPEGAAKIVWEKVDQSSTTLNHQTGMAKEVAKIVVPEGFDPAKIGYMDPALIKQTADIALKYKVISKIPEKIYTTEAWDAATAK